VLLETEDLPLFSKKTISFIVTPVVTHLTNNFSNLFFFLLCLTALTGVKVLLQEEHPYLTEEYLARPHLWVLPLQKGQEKE
jgi:hypothetical protein